MAWAKYVGTIRNPQHFTPSEDDEYLPHGSSEPMAVYYCLCGCGRMACVASEQNFARYCCRSCAETGKHSVKCDEYWPGMRVRIRPKSKTEPVGDIPLRTA